MLIGSILLVIMAYGTATTTVEVVPRHPRRPAKYQQALPQSPEQDG